MINTIAVTFLFIFGLAIGSFLNVVVYRLNLNFHLRGEIRRHLGGVFGILGGRSFCPKCKKKIAWHDNIPLLSFVLLKGRCRYCKKPISWQYPLVELATGILTVLVFLSTSEVKSVDTSEVSLGFIHLGGVFITIYYLLITYSLIAIFVSDLLYFTIPDEVTYPAMGLALVYQTARASYFSPPSEESPPAGGATSEVFLGFGHLGDAFLAGLGALAFFLLLVAVTRGKGMGIGDVKLAGLMGLVLGYPGIVVAIMIAFLTGALAGVILILLGRKRFGEHLPFGPFLVGAVGVALVWGDRIVDFYLSLLGI